MKRPKHLEAPAYLSPSPPVPQRLDPTRFGDWEKKGIAVDF